MPNNSKIDPKELKELQKIHNEKYFLRIAGFADIVERFVALELKGKVNLLKTWILAILVAAGGSITPGELQRYLLRTRHSISQTIDSLLTDGLVTRSNDRKDRRVVNIQITKEGLSYMKQTYRDIDIAEDEIRASISQEELKKLASLMKSLRQRLIQKIADKI